MPTKLVDYRPLGEVAAITDNLRKQISIAISKLTKDETTSAVLIYCNIDNEHAYIYRYRLGEANVVVEFTDLVTFIQICISIYSEKEIVEMELEDL